MLPSNKTPSCDIVTPVLPIKIRPFVRVTAISPVGVEGNCICVLGKSSRNWPALPTFFVIAVSTSLPIITFLGVKYFCVVERWSKLPLGNK